MTPVRAAQLGAKVLEGLGNWRLEYIKMHDELFAGRQYQGRDINQWLEGGYFLDYPGMDVPKNTKLFGTLLDGMMINYMWTAGDQPVFLLGGFPCSQENPLGRGPRASGRCVNGEAWFLYSFAKSDEIGTRSVGWYTRPRGFDHLGQGRYTDITLEVGSIRHTYTNSRT